MTLNVMKWTYEVGCAVTILILFTTVVFADELAGEENHAHPFKPVIVIAGGLSSRSDLDPYSPTNPYRMEESARAGAEVFTKEDIETIKPQDVNDLLDKAVGVNITYQGRKSPYFISQRGGGSYTYILDGAVLPPSSNRILYKIPVSAIEEIQVVRGATTLTLGSSIPIGASSSGSALNTGYIIIRTKRPSETEATLKTSLEKGTGGGHPTAHKESLFIGTQMATSSFLEGYVGGMIATMDRPGKDTWFDGQDSEGMMGVTGFRAGKFSLNMMAYHDSGRFEMQRGIDADHVRSDVKWYYDPLKTTVYTGHMTMCWTPNQTSLINLFYTRFEQEEHNESFISDTASMKEYEEKTKGVGFRHNARFAHTLFQVGAQMSNSTGYGPNTSKSYNKYDTTVTGWSGSVEQELFHGRLVLDGGYREDTKHIDNASTSAANADVQNDVDMAPSKVFALGAHIAILDKLVFDGRYFHGRQGTSGDFDMRAETGRLHPEEQDRFELSLSADPTPYIKPAVAWFSVETENGKSASGTTYETDTGTYYYYTESDDLRQGIEVRLTGTMGSKTSYKASWTHMLKDESIDDGVTTDNLGSSKPENLYGLVLTHKWRANTANLSVKTVDKWVQSISPRGLAEVDGLGDYTRVDANIQRDFIIGSMKLNVTLYGRNITDERYATRYVTGYYYDRGCIFGTEVTLTY